MVTFSPREMSIERILCLGAHCDDIEIGCGGTILEILANLDQARVDWVIFTSTEERKREAEKAARLFCNEAADLNIRIFDYRDGFLPYSQGAVKDSFEALKLEVGDPDLIFTHYRNDLHQDHRIVSELTWNTFRDHFILEYEIPKWDGDIGNPNAYISIPEARGRQKIDILQQVYNSQNQKTWFTDDLFWSMMRIRGMECRSTSNIAEAFYARKSTFSFGKA